MCQIYNPETALKPLIKWPGGKEKELEIAKNVNPEEKSIIYKYINPYDLF